MTKLWFFSMIFASAGACLLAPAAAEACSCITNGEFFVAPAKDARGVPTNTKIWSGQQFGQTVDIFDSGLQPVAVTETQIVGNDGTISAFTPVSPLRLGERYTVVAGGSELSAFTVEVEADQDAPKIPVETNRESHSEGGGIDLFGGSSCGDESHTVSITLQHQGIFSVADAGDGAMIEANGPSGNVTTIGFQPQLLLGTGACIYNWQGAGSGDDTQIRFGAFDLAGNFSGWSEAALLESPNSCTCVAAASETTSAFWCLVFGTGALFLISRRRR